MSSNAPAWKGRFPRNDIISLLDTDRPFNLAESTTRNLRLRELLEIAALDHIEDLELGYGSCAGLPELRAVVGEICNVPAQCVLATTGAALALSLLALEVCRPGDEVVLVSPCFPPSRDLFSGVDVAVHEVRLEFETGYATDPAHIAAHLSEKTRLVCLTSPHNPSGVHTPAQTVSAILAQMTERSPDALLFVDETYLAATHDGRGDLTSVAALDPRILTASSVSKAHGTPGLRVGWLTVPDAQLRERLTVAKMNLVIGGSVLTETLAAGLLRQRDAVLAPRRALLGNALQRLEQWQATETHRVQWIRPDAGALCCMRLDREAFDQHAVARFWELLPSHDLQLANGQWFGETDRVFRLGFGYLPLESLSRALAALSRVMDQAQQPGNRHIKGDQT